MRSKGLFMHCRVYQSQGGGGHKVGCLATYSAKRAQSILLGGLTLDVVNGMELIL